MNLFFRFLLLCTLFQPLPILASTIQLVSRDTSLTFDVGGGAGAAVDRLRILDSSTSLTTYTFNQNYTAFDSSAQGAGTASGALSVNETIATTPTGLVLDLGRGSTGTAEWLAGTGNGFATLLNQTSIVFDVVGTVTYELTASMSEGANGPYQGHLVFQNTDPAFAPILQTTTNLARTVFTGILTTGTYRAFVAMNGFVSATAANPNPPAAFGHYGLRLVLTVPEPGTAWLLGFGLVGLAVAGGPRSGAVHRGR